MTRDPFYGLMGALASLNQALAGYGMKAPAHIVLEHGEIMRLKACIPPAFLTVKEVNNCPPGEVRLYGIPFVEKNA